jgi:superfamily I DNA/RNA helicase
MMVANQVPEIYKIIGRPGTGKTTYLLHQIELAAAKYGPEKIGAVSLTKAATEEMRDRIISVTGIARKTIQNVRTIHSHCFKLLELKKDHVADTKIRQFNEENPAFTLPYQARLKDDDDSGVISQAVRDNQRRFNDMVVFRNQMRSRSTWDALTIDFDEAWQRWMYINDLCDYTGMIEKCFEDQLCPDIDVLFIDEAQDLSMLSASLMLAWAKKVKVAIFVGDADQCIFRFAGAVPEVFINVKHTWSKVLEQSYRVPPVIHTYAQSIIKQALNREDAPWKPKTNGTKGTIVSCRMPDLSLPGTHMILTRCNFQHKRWRKWCLAQGVTYHNPYQLANRILNPCHSASWRALQTYKRLKNGEAVSFAAVKEMAEKTVSKGNMAQGAKGALDKLQSPTKNNKVDFFYLPEIGFLPHFMEFKQPAYECLLLSGIAKDLAESVPEEHFLDEPKVCIGTVHSVKGGESSHVWLDCRTTANITRRISMHEQAFWDEVRVVYVAITRAKETLGLLKRPGLQNRTILP